MKCGCIGLQRFLRPAKRGLRVEFDPSRTVMPYHLVRTVKALSRKIVVHGENPLILPIGSRSVYLPHDVDDIVPLKPSLSHDLPPE
jgi:hypothetical protein